MQISDSNQRIINYFQNKEASIEGKKSDWKVTTIALAVLLGLGVLYLATISFPVWIAVAIGAAGCASIGLISAQIYASIEKKRNHLHDEINQFNLSLLNEIEEITQKTVDLQSKNPIEDTIWLVECKQKREEDCSSLEAVFLSDLTKAPPKPLIKQHLRFAGGLPVSEEKKDREVTFSKKAEIRTYDLSEEEIIVKQNYSDLNERRDRREPPKVCYRDVIAGRLAKVNADPYWQ